MLTKIVNGVAIPLTPQEEASVLSDWAKADASSAVSGPILDARKANIAALEMTLNNLANLPDFAPADIKNAVMALIKLRQLKGDFVSAAPIPTT